MLITNTQTTCKQKKPEYERQMADIGNACTEDISDMQASGKESVCIFSLTEL
jgi:hypothetical protein